MSSLPTIADIYRWFLYGKSSTPNQLSSGELIRDPENTDANGDLIEYQTKIDINIPEYMEFGAVKFKSYGHVLS